LKPRVYAQVLLVFVSVYSELIRARDQAAMFCRAHHELGIPRSLLKSLLLESEVQHTEEQCTHSFEGCTIQFIPDLNAARALSSTAATANSARACANTLVVYPSGPFLDRITVARLTCAAAAPSSDLAIATRAERQSESKTPGSESKVLDSSDAADQTEAAAIHGQNIASPALSSSAVPSAGSASEASAAVPNVAGATPVTGPPVIETRFMTVWEEPAPAISDEARVIKPTIKQIAVSQVLR